MQRYYAIQEDTNGQFLYCLFREELDMPDIPLTEWQYGNFDLKETIEAAQSRFGKYPCYDFETLKALA